LGRFVIDIGSQIETVTPAELERAFFEQDEKLAAQLAGIKYRRLPILSGTAQSGVLDIGGDKPAGWSGHQVGPASGYMWEVKLLAVNGLTTGTTPDIVNLYILGAGSSLAWWQFNGNNFAYTFGHRELVLLPNEYLRLASVGTFAATGTVSLTGSVIQAPAERYMAV
jgi:hypothetical protein